MLFLLLDLNAITTNNKYIRTKKHNNYNIRCMFFEIVDCTLKISAMERLRKANFDLSLLPFLLIASNTYEINPTNVISSHRMSSQDQTVEYPVSGDRFTPSTPEDRAPDP